MLEELAGKIGSSYLEQPIVEVKPILGKGRINRIFVVRAESRQIVVRINDLIPAPDAPEGYAKEQWCLEQTAAIGVPGPAVLQVGERDNHAFMVQSLVPGANAADVPAKQAMVWTELGRYARLMHNVDVSRASVEGQESASGLFSPLSVTTHAAWLRCIQAGIDALTEAEDVLAGDVYPRNQTDDIVAGIEELKAVPFRAGLNHGDLSLTNAMIDSDGCVYLLDWGSALAHAVPYYDLSQMLKIQAASNEPDTSQIEAFLTGYGISLPDMPAVRSTSARLLLLRAFAKARWAIRNNHPEAHSFASIARRAWNHIPSNGP